MCENHKLSAAQLQKRRQRYDVFTNVEMVTSGQTLLPMTEPCLTLAAAFIADASVYMCKGQGELQS